MQTERAEKIIPVLLSGGSGTRLWPVSREEYPKQFHGLLDAHYSLMEETLQRVLDPERFLSPVILGNHAHRFLIAEQLAHCGVESPHILIEPCIRNTAPAITAAALFVEQHFPDRLMLVLPTDQYILDCDAFLDSVRNAVRIAKKGYLVTFGIEPEYAETGYGYIQRGEALEGEEAFRVAAFIEKPNLTASRQFVASDHYFWNSGIFLFSPQFLLEEMSRYHPDMVDDCQLALKMAVEDAAFIHLNEEAFCQTPSISIDYALMERTGRAAIVPLNCGWSDTGAWEAIWRISAKDGDGNVEVGACHLMNSRNNYIRNEKGPMIATYGVDNLVIVATKDAVLVARKDGAQSVKALVEDIRKHNPQIISQNSHVSRPWGTYESINSGPRYQVKLIQVKPGEKLSLQMHYHRAEHWVVVAGTAKVTCDETHRILTENQSIYIPYGSVHRIENPGKIDLEIIEVQSGPYLGEDDIVRFEDQYGRIDQAG